MGLCQSNATLDDACQNCDSKQLRKLVKQGHNVNQNFYQGWCTDFTTCLHICLSGNNDEVSQRRGQKCLKILLDAGADPNKLNYLGQTPIMIAAGNDSASVRALVDAGGDIHTQNSKVQTALSIAVFNGNIACVKTLLLEGANIKERVAYHNGYILYAAKHCNIKLLRCLLDANCDTINHRCLERGSTALHQCLLLSSKDHTLELIQLLVDNGADINIMDNSGRRPIHWALLFQNKVAVRVFLALNSNINSPSMTNILILDYIYRLGLTKFMEECGYTLGHSNFTRVPPLQSCCRKTIRRTLISRPNFKIKSLPLPDSIKKYLQLFDFEM